MSQPGRGVEARCERHHAARRDQPLGGAQAPEAAVARRHARRPARVGGEGEVDQPRRHRSRRAARRAAGHAVGRGRVERRAVVDVVAVQAEGELVGDHLAEQRRAGGEQRARRCGHAAAPAPDGWPARSGCRRRSGWPATSKTSLATKRRPCNGPCARAFDHEAAVRHPGADAIVDGPAHAKTSRPLSRQRRHVLADRARRRQPDRRRVARPGDVLAARGAGDAGDRAGRRGRDAARCPSPAAASRRLLEHLVEVVDDHVGEVLGRPSGAPRSSGCRSAPAGRASTRALPAARAQRDRLVVVAPVERVAVAGFGEQVGRAARLSEIHGDSQPAGACRSCSRDALAAAQRAARARRPRPARPGARSWCGRGRSARRRASRSASTSSGQWS